MRKETLILIGSLLGTGLIVFLLVLPAWDSLTSTRSLFDQQKNQLADAQGVADKILELQEQYQQNYDDFEKLAAILPETQEISSMLVQLESLAAANGLIMESVDLTKAPEVASGYPPQVSQEEQGILAPETEMAEDSSQVSGQPLGQEAGVVLPYKISLINLKLSGSYPAFKSYLQAVEKNIRLMDMVSLNFSSQASQFGQPPGGPLIFSFSVIGNVYHQF